MKTETYVEKDCVIELSGKRFETGGAVVTPERCIGYPKFEKEFVGARGSMTDWHGNEIGKCVIVSSWKTPRSYVSGVMHQIEARIAGVLYTGRGAGTGMSYVGKVKRG